MSVIRYRVTLHESAIFTALEGEPNSAVSYDFIPGSAIRGMVIGAYGSIDLADDAVRRLFFSDAVRFLNAYVVDGETDQRSLPVPLSWVCLKDKKTPITDTAIERNKPELSGSEDKPQTKAVKGFAVIASQGQASIPEVERVLNVHTQRARQADDGLLYRYDALAAGQVFEGAILCDDRNDALILFGRVNKLGNVTLGGATSAGYGRCTFKLLDGQPATEWAETQSGVGGDRRVLTLTSDAILRDEFGSYRPTLAALEQALGVKVAQAFLDTTLVGGFNRKWGLPLPQTPALKRGSVIVLDAEASITAEVLERGIGERRNEGFGRAVLGWQRMGQYERIETNAMQTSALAVTEPSALSDASRRLWTQINKRLREQQLEDRGVSVAYEQHYTIKGPVTRTQLARLRSQIADELRKDKPSITISTAFLAEVEGKAAGMQYERSQIADKSLAEWLKNPHFREFGDQKLRADVVLRLVDAVLERAQKERKRGRG